MKFSYTPKPKAPGQGGKFLKLGDGDSVTGVFRGDVHTVFAKWVNDTYVSCPPNDPDAKPRHKVNFVIQENGKFIAKIFEMSDMLHTRLFELDHQIRGDTKDDPDGPKDIEMIKCRISRKGLRKDTKWSLDPVVGGLLTKGHLIAISQVELNILNGRKQEDPLPPPFDDGFPPDDIPMPSFEDIPF